MQQPESFPVCRGCGVLAPSSQGECARCGTATGEHVAWVPFRSDGALSVAIEMEFQCRACGHFAPTNFLDLDGSLACAHCGIEQAFPARRFGDVLKGAHNVGDLAGPNAEGHPAYRTESIGADNPFAAIGSTDAQLATELKRSEELDLKVRLRLSRGRPLCHSCQMPVELYPEPQGKVTTLCSYCQDRAEYALPTGAESLYPPLVGVVADEHRSDWKRSETVAGGAAGAVAIQCPSCHAPLQVSATSALAECKYCSTQSVVPARAWARAAGDGAKPRMWFALFRGPSKQRERMNDAAVEQREQREESQRHHAAAANRAGQLGSRPKLRKDGWKKRPGNKRGPWLAIFLGLVLIASLAAAVLIFIAEEEARQAAHGSAARKKKPTGKLKRKANKATKRAPPARADFNELDHCTCLTEIDGKAGLESIALAQRIERDGSGKLLFELYMDVEGKKPVYLPLSAKTAPPSRPKGVALAIAMACEKNVVALISGNRATGWSAKTGKLLWTKRITGSYEHPKPPPPKQGRFSTWCERMQPVGGQASLNIGGGKKLQIRVKDGRLTIR